MRAQVLLSWLCLVAAALQHEATSARLPRTQPPKVTSPVIPEADDTNQFYAAVNHECRKCPPGTFVHKHCTVLRTEGICRPCENNTYSKHLNSFVYCFGCRACRNLDEVEIKKCTPTTNSECACKNGTFCSPGQPCETCTKCMTSCGPGEKKAQDCTPTSDILCVPDTTLSPPTNSPGQGDRRLLWLLMIPVVLLIVLVGGVRLCWKKNTSFRNACRDFWSCKRTQFLQYLQRSSSPEPSEERDNERNMRRTETSQILLPPRSTANGHASETRTLLRDSPPTEEGGEHVEMRNLVPENCQNSAEALSQSFDVFVSMVPQEYWKRFMRLLRLSPNEIDSAQMSAHFVNDQHYQMLRIWLDKNGKAATLRALLEALSSMDLNGIVEDITSILIDKRLYIYEEQILSQVVPS